MKKFSAVFCMCAVSCAVCAQPSSGVFSADDSVLREATRVYAATAAMKSAFAAERARLADLEKSYAALVESKRARLAEIKRANEKRLSDSRALSAKIERDERALAELSAFLDSFFSEMASDSRVRSLLERSGVSFGGFSERTVPEKFRALCSALTFLSSEDAKVSRGNGVVSSGVFVSASGKDSGGVPLLKVQRKGGGNEK